MSTIFFAQLKKELRRPLFMILLIGASVGVTLLFTGSTQAPMQVAIFSEEVSQDVLDNWEEKLNGNSSFQFETKEAAEALEDVKEGRRDLAIRINNNDYQVVTSSEFPEIAYVEQHVQKAFHEEAMMKAAVSQADNPENMREELEGYLENPPLKIEVSSLKTDDLNNYDIKTQLAFAFALLVAMFLIGFRISNILKDKVTGVRNRILLSPISKTQMYLGYISYSMMIGTIQTLIVFLIFQNFMNYDLGDNFAMLVVITIIFSFSMASIAMLITGMLRTPEQFLAIYPSVIPLLPVISGAYMMPGALTNPVLNFIGDLFPISHAMNAFVEVAFFNPDWIELLKPIVFMLLIGVIAMGIGINLMERRSA
ncbi:ABC-2 type transport system permease protein [Gracilibacillus halotolerans]|uniref:ABC-2 type transport system permease protein n=1 Tax=Gracilibacillus halotolerans TaxID=74386 RepID=A0A841RLM1_9BACI|nr:ABC transporter permease [Gracilibacillus halotolerans]MBB6512065.1 ABC-2 type transport system permease protein [Gracilibacillus halotolerans]